MRAAPHERRIGSGLTTVVSAAVALAGLALLVVVFRAGSTPTSGAGSGGADSGSATVYVGGKGCEDGRSAAAAAHESTPWCSLPRALRSAPSGASVLVAPGRYPRLTVNGTKGPYRSVRVSARDPGNPPRLGGLTLTGVSNVGVSNVVFTGGAGIVRSSRVRLSDNRFEGAGVYVRSSSDVTIAGNRIEHLRGIRRGLLAQGSAGSSAPGNRDLVIRDNVFDDIQHDAIAVFNSHRHVLIAGNRISNVREPANFPYHTDAMQLMGGADVTVRNNVIWRVTHGILIKDGVASTGLTVERNLVTKCPGAGLQVFNAPGARVSHNTIWGTAFGMVLDDVPSIAGKDSVTLEDNVLDELTVASSTAVADASGNVFGQGTPVGDGSSIGTPAFVDPAKGDYRIRSSGSGSGPVPGAQLRVG